MEKITHIMSACLLCFTVMNSKAEEPPIIRKGLLRAQATIAPAVFFSNKQAFFYVHGNLEGYVTPTISIAGDAYFSVGNTSSAKPVFAFNHNIFFGAAYHVVRKNNDFYVGLQPGIAITKLAATPEVTHKMKTGVNPVASLVVGYNYYVHPYFHFFVQTRFIAGQHLYDVQKDISEFRFSAGLGFNINAIKK